MDWPQIGHGKLQRILQLISDVASDAQRLGDTLIGAHDTLSHQSIGESRQIAEDLEVRPSGGSLTHEPPRGERSRPRSTGQYSRTTLLAPQSVFACCQLVWPFRRTLVTC